MMTHLMAFAAGAIAAIAVIAVAIVAGGYGEELRTGERDKRRP